MLTLLEGSSPHTTWAPNLGLVAAGIQDLGSGTFVGGGSGGQLRMSRTTKIVKFYIPGRKITRSGILQYEGGSGQIKFFDYHFIIYAYSNYGTVDLAATAFNVAYLNDCYIKMHYKDA